MGKADKPADTSAHERPWWLRCEEARVARKTAADTAVAAHLAATGGQTGGAVSNRSSEAALKHQGPTEVAPCPSGRPRTPSSQLKALSSVAQQHLRVTPCTEYHREYWLPPKPQARREHLHETIRENQRVYGTKDKVWGKRPTDNRTAGWYVENMWGLRSLKRSQSDPSVLAEGEMPRHKQPWTKSDQFQSCCVGGIGGGKKGRNIGLYEDSFVQWKEYKLPERGLSSTDVTQMSDAMVKQKALGRK
eukprot:gb/GFBE01023020.1/.p1 GENE.gb/GFBE01023020.1/~~gb/GFBE01023020.1/.p1  ORF type:complete len:247 (+),score=27.70 gb/GFBE01023020.1/:1-741(+)